MNTEARTDLHERIDKLENRVLGLIVACWLLLVLDLVLMFR